MRRRPARRYAAPARRGLRTGPPTCLRGAMTEPTSDDAPERTSDPPTEHAAQVAVLSTGLDQFFALLEEVPADRAGAPTPCTEWTVADLVDHVVRDVAMFAVGVRGGTVDWGAATPHQDEPVAAYRRGVADLLAAWEEHPEAQPGPAWQAAEVAVHTWDLATALGRPTDGLEPVVADLGAGFVRAALTPERRGSAFGPEQPAPEGANAYERLAAFAGRRVDRQGVR